MTSARPLATLLAGLAVAAAVAPVSTLLDPRAWSASAVIVMAVVLGIGMGLRTVTSSVAVIASYQLVGSFVTLLLLHVPETLRWGFPTQRTFEAVNDLLLQAIGDVARYAAPVPGSPGMAYAVSALVALATLAVDTVAVTLRRPAPAGLVLLTTFMASSTNSGAGLSIGWFVVAAAAWLALLGHEGLAQLSSWGLQPLSSARRSAHETLAGTGRVITLLAILATVAGATLLPHLPTRFLADGLGRTAEGVGGGTRGFSLSTSADLATSLTSRSDAPFFTYVPSDAPPDVFRVEILDTFDGAVWSASTGSSTGPATELELLSDPEVSGTTHQIEVSENVLQAPQVALPIGTVGNPFPRIRWGLTSLGAVRLDGAAPAYTASYVRLDPSDADLSTVEGGLRPIGATDQLSSTPELEEQLVGILNQIIDRQDTPLEKARAIQAYLRGPQFSYSLTVDGRSERALERFLTTKQGYCVHFAAAMVLLSERAGIPARMAAGFLQGTRVDGRYVVRANDAHAWPELYFPRVGWVRFEPTPGGRSGVAPAYTTTPVTPSTSPTTSAGPRATPTPTRRPDVDEATGAGSSSTTTLPAPLRWAREHALALGAGTLLLLALLAMPATRALARRRRHRRARSQAARVEEQWADLIYQLRDLDLEPPRGATPRQVGRYVATRSELGAGQISALGATVLAVERARYSREPADDDADAVGPHIDVIVDAVARRTPWWTRVRARLWPREGVQTWRGLLRRGSGGRPR